MFDVIAVPGCDDGCSAQWQEMDVSALLWPPCPIIVLQGGGAGGGGPVVWEKQRYAEAGSWCQTLHSCYHHLLGSFMPCVLKTF